jgi:dynein heavy chain
MTETIFCDF